MPALPTSAPAPARVALPERRAACALAVAPGVGPVRWRALLTESEGDARGALARVAPGAAGEALLRQADALLRHGRDAGLHLLLLGDPDYPVALLDLPDPPPLLWRAGALPTSPARPSVAIVGTRTPTPYGTRTARAFAGALARAGVLVVSGMARGIDAAAHEAALDAGGPSVAVLGTGADVPYPAAHRALHARLCRLGAVLAEAPPGARATPGAFPRRNRLIAALADVVVVVEAGARSGALITAGVAADLGRTVAALPGPIDAPESAGTNGLLRDGAHLLAGIDDLLALVGVAPERPAADGEAPRSAPLPAGLTADEQAIWRVLATRPLDADRLVWETGLPADRCVAAITTLELAGLVTSRVGGEIERC